MPSERLYPGQLWKHASMRVIVVAVHPNSVTYEFLSGGQSVTQSLDVFLAVFSGPLEECAPALRRSAGNLSQA